MAKRTKKTGRSGTSSATIGFGAKLWLAADKLRIRDLAPQGKAGFVLANGRMSAHQFGKGEKRPPLRLPADIGNCRVPRGFADHAPQLGERW